jgi:hypothetical protein
VSFTGNLGDPEEIPNPNAEMGFEETAMARPDVETDTRAIAERIYDGLAERFPGWVARDGNLEVGLTDEWSAVAAELRQEAVTVPEAIYQTYGEEVLGIPATPPAPATATSSWSAIDDQGYTVTAGTQLTLARTGDDLVAFEVLSSVEIPPGQRAIDGVELVAIADGTQGNNLDGPGELIDPLSWVEAIDVTQPSAGGLDGQTLEDYLTQLIMLMRLVALRPILPLDFAIMALRVPGVGRAVAMDLFEPATGTWGHARTITLVLTDPDGERADEPVKQQVAAYLDVLREVNFVIHVIDATYEEIDVAYQVVAFAEQDPTMVKEACEAALLDYLAPANFRLGTTSPSIVGGEQIDPPAPGQSPGRQTLRVNDLVSLLDRQRGVDFVPVGGVQINGQADDYTLTQPFTLPRPGDIGGTVTVPSPSGGATV